MDIHIVEVFRLAREAQGIKQSELARRTGISQPLMSQFENGQVPLSRDKLLRMADLLGINPAILDDHTALPFKSQKLFKMYFRENILSGMDYYHLERLVDFTKSVDILFLIATSKSERVDRMVAKTIIGQFTQAALVRDQDGNLFLFRRKRRGAYLVGELDLQARLREKAQKEGKTIRFGSVRISRELSQKINDLTAEREDVESLFDMLQSESPVQREQKIEEVVREIREGGHDPAALLNLLRALRSSGLDLKDLSNLLKRKGD